jgi:hypothetical protein
VVALIEALSSTVGLPLLPSFLKLSHNHQRMRGVHWPRSLLVCVSLRLPSLDPQSAGRIHKYPGRAAHRVFKPTMPDSSLSLRKTSERRRPSPIDLIGLLVLGCRSHADAETPCFLCAVSALLKIREATLQPYLLPLVRTSPRTSLKESKLYHRLKGPLQGPSMHKDALLI